MTHKGRYNFIYSVKLKCKPMSEKKRVETIIQDSNVNKFPQIRSFQDGRSARKSIFFYFTLSDD